MVLEERLDKINKEGGETRKKAEALLGRSERLLEEVRTERSFLKKIYGVLKAKIIRYAGEEYLRKSDCYLHQWAALRREQDYSKKSN